MQTSISFRDHNQSKPPDERLRFDPEALGLVEPSRAYFRRATETVARDLIGAWIARRYQGQWYGARIVETEAYLGAGDAAAHSWRGRRTARVEPMYSDGGYLYVFFVYGMHHCVNVVTRTVDIAEAVLLRAAEPLLPVIAPRLLSGPGRLCASLGITIRHSGKDLLGQEEIRLFKRSGRRLSISISPRIGIDYAGDARSWPLRFYDRNSPAVSGPGSRQRLIQKASS
jgi:DNA-3-methyladenine glycosylase